VATTADEAVQVATDAGYPVALKVVSSDIVHKTDVGGVRTGIGSDVELREAFAAMQASIRQNAPTARIDGFLVQPMKKGHVETIVGLHRDPSFGPLLMFGLGGVYVEALHDVLFRLAPVSDAEALDMIAGLRSSVLFKGLRGAPPADRKAIASVIRRVAQLGIDYPAIAELDINPLLIVDGGVVAVDARIRLGST
jgi:acetyltransferase